MEELCGVLGSVEKEAEGGGSEERELSIFTQALKKLLEELPSVKERNVLARVFAMAAGHSGQHYWTNTENRQLANG